MYQILIVDDSVFDIDCITFLIKQHNLPLEVRTAVNGLDALKLFQNPDIHFDILFTDIRMPFLDGLGLAREVRVLSPETRLIIFSGFNDFEYAKTAITIGVEDYLVKPIVPDEFVSVMNRVIHAVEESRLLNQVRLNSDRISNPGSEEPGSYLKSDKIKQYIYRNFAQPLSLNDIAGHFYISPNYLCSVFKKETGYNLMKFINEYRLKQAAKLLLETEMKVNKIAELVGFPTPSYFSQRFRDYYGQSPENYRQKETY